MILNSKTGRQVPRKPNLDSIERRKPRADIASAATSDVDFKHGIVLEKEYPSTHAADKALLVALGVNGEVPLAQAMVNAGLGKGRMSEAELLAGIAALTPANDNKQSRVAA